MQQLEAAIASCGGEPFVDAEFPPQPTSLISNWQEDSEEIQNMVATWKEYQWKRTSDIECLNDDEGKLQIFAGKVEPNDIKQGSLGNCYFLSSLSVLSEKEHRIKDIFVSSEINPEGVFGLKLCKNGEQQTIILDSHIPCNPHGTPCFSQAHGNELWVMLLEKAWAKSHGSYERIVGGQAHETLRDLTGAPAWEFASDEPDAFERILEGEKKDYCMAAGISTQSAAESAKFKELGLIDGHSYGLISAAAVTNKDGHPAHLVKLRNPWGKTEWQGAWGDNSDEWTDELKSLLGVDGADDGTFWMCFDDVKDYFSRIALCKVVDGNDFAHMGAEQQPDGYSLFRMEVPETGHYTLSVSQKGSRMYPRGAEYEYSNCRMILMRLDGGSITDGVTYVRGGKGFKDRDAYLECPDLGAGTYYFFVEMEWLEKSQEKEFNATSYGPGKVNFVAEESEQYNKEDVLFQALLSKQDQGIGEITETDMADKKAPLIVKYVCSKPDDGYMYTIIKNEEDEAIYTETVNYPNFKGLTLLPPFKNTGYTLRVEPEETKMVIIRASCGGYGYSMSYSTQVQLSDNSVRLECLDNGEKKERAPGIVQHFLWHSSGIMIIYTNSTDGSTLNETLKFTLKGLQIDGQDDNTQVTVSVGPGEEKMVKILPTGGEMSYSTSASYSIS